jgi:preprotein translocase subunit YajC
MDMDHIALQTAITIGVFVVFYIALVRPQQKRLQRHKTMIANLRPGDRVTTAGGLIGTIVSVRDEETVTIELTENMHVVVMRNKIDGVLTQPARRQIDGDAIAGGPLSA